MGEPTIVVRIETEVELAPDSVWPDGDASEAITAEAVTRVMESCGDKDAVLRRWDLLYDPAVTVTVTQVNPAWQPGPALLPEHVPDRWVQTTAEVWE